MPTITGTIDGYTITFPSGEQVFCQSKATAEAFLDWWEMKQLMGK